MKFSCILFIIYLYFIHLDTLTNVYTVSCLSKIAVTAHQD